MQRRRPGKSGRQEGHALPKERVFVDKGELNLILQKGFKNSKYVLSNIVEGKDSRGFDVLKVGFHTGNNQIITAYVYSDGLVKVDNPREDVHTHNYREAQYFLQGILKNKAD